MRPMLLDFGEQILPEKIGGGPRSDRRTTIAGFRGRCASGIVSTSEPIECVKEAAEEF